MRHDEIHIAYQGRIRMTKPQELHFARKFMKGLKRNYQLNKQMREKGYLPRLDPKRLPR